MSYENWQIEKERIILGDESALEEYNAAAAWCNESGQYTIIDDGEFYRVVKLPEPEPEQESPTDEEIAANME